jgi:hypothetical protein
MFKRGEMNGKSQRLLLKEYNQRFQSNKESDRFKQTSKKNLRDSLSSSIHVGAITITMALVVGLLHFTLL